MTRLTLTVACPEAYRGDATHLGVCLGWSEDYTPAEWWGAFSAQYQDGEGNLYRVMSMEVDAGFVAKAAPNVPVDRPAADTENTINLTPARRAQDKLVIWTPTAPPQPMPTAVSSRIVAIAGVSGRDALAAMGLTQIPQGGT